MVVLMEETGPRQLTLARSTHPGQGGMSIDNEQAQDNLAQRHPLYPGTRRDSFSTFRTLASRVWP